MGKGERGVLTSTYSLGGKEETGSRDPSMRKGLPSGRLGGKRKRGRAVPST